MTYLIWSQSTLWMDVVVCKVVVANVNWLTTSELRPHFGTLLKLLCLCWMRVTSYSPWKWHQVQSWVMSWLTVCNNHFASAVCWWQTHPLCHKDINEFADTLNGDLHGLYCCMEQHELVEMDTNETELMTLDGQSFQSKWQQVDEQPLGTTISEWDSWQSNALLLSHQTRRLQYSLCCCRLCMQSQQRTTSEGTQDVMQLTCSSPLDCCSVVWHSCNQTLSQRLEHSQKYAVRIISVSPTYAESPLPLPQRTAALHYPPLATSQSHAELGVPTIASSRLPTTWLDRSDLSRPPTPAHPPKKLQGATSYTPLDPVQTNLDCHLRTRVPASGACQWCLPVQPTAAGYQSDPDKAYHVSSMR